MTTQIKPKKTKKEAIFTVLRQISYTKLYKKYSSGDFSFNKICKYLVKNNYYSRNTLYK